MHWLKLLQEPGTAMRNGMLRLKTLLADESDQTRAMLDIYRRSLVGGASREELQQANTQFGDVLRMAGLGTFFVAVPGSMLLIPLVVKAGQRLGVRVLPDTFEEARPTTPRDQNAWMQAWAEDHEQRTSTTHVVVDNTTVEVDPGVFNPCTLLGPSAHMLMDAVARVQGGTVLDIGCGTGVVSIHAALSGAASVIACDSDAAACANARRNIDAYGLSDIIDCRISDVFDACANAQADHITANLPLKESLWGVDPVPIVHRLIDGVPDHLRPGGRASLVMASFGAVDTITPTLRSAGWVNTPPITHMGVQWWLEQFERQP